MTPRGWPIMRGTHTFCPGFIEYKDEWQEQATLENLCDALEYLPASADCDVNTDSGHATISATGYCVLI
jgi:hypothetical protein